MLEIFTSYATFSSLKPVVQVVFVVATFGLAYGVVDAIGRRRGRS